MHPYWSAIYKTKQEVHLNDLGIEYNVLGWDWSFLNKETFAK